MADTGSPPKTDTGPPPAEKPEAQPNISAPISTSPSKDAITRTNPVTCLRFNQDGTSLIVATQDGFRVFDLSALGEIVMVYDFATIPQVTQIQRLYNSNLVAFVSALDPSALKVLNMRRNDVICEYRYGGPVRWLAMNRVRVVVAAEEKVFIHKIRNMEVINTISDVTGNPKNFFTMATYELRSFLAYPCEEERGKIAVYDLDCFRESYRIDAHRAPIEALCFNDYVTRLATSSSKGTVVRVFDAIRGVKLHELRRGMRAVIVHSLAFSPSGEYLSCSSEHETVHVFKIPTNPQRAKDEEEQGWLGSMGHLATQATGLICSEIERYMQEERSFVTLPNPYHGTRTVLNVIAAEGQEQLRLQICGMNGFMNGFIIEKKETEWTCELQTAYFLTEVVVKAAGLAKLVAKASRRQGHRSKSKNTTN